MMRRSPLSAIFALAAFICLGLGASPDPSGELAPLWDQAMKALHDNAPKDAVRLLNDFVDLGVKQGIRSPEAHYNLGLAHWSAKQPGKAVYNLMESARLRSSPLSAMKALSTLEGIEREIGIRDGVSDDVSFRLFFLLNPDWILALATLSFWLVVAVLVMWWLRGKAASRAMTSCLCVAAVFSAIAMFGTLNRRYFCDFGVLVGEGDGGEGSTIPLFRTAANKEEDKLVDLPAGTIVALGPTENDFIQIQKPIAGWVPAAGVKALARE